MLIFKCKMCGGDIQATEGQVHGMCDSCGTTSTLPRASDERLVNLFNRANQQRQKNDFDKAMANYENILNDDATNAEAHWGVVLCRYGIEYVEDPRSHERIPTCHRVQYESILSDNDYLAALENAPDSYARELYENEAKKISEIQKGILAISNTEEPYDVFICYKETTDGGSRTKDSALAQDIYYQLEKEGFKTFFARITLEGKLGQQYEPYIFAALNSAKVMLVIGTDPAYFNAVWVKNEWSRFLLLMKKDRTKLLIPCFKDMDAYDIPEELSLFQSQDMSKIGFMQDLIHGIKKVIAKPKAGEAPVTTTTITASSGDTGVAGLLRRAFLFLEDGEFKQAGDYCDRVLDTEPENARAYVGLLLAELEIKREDELANNEYPLTQSTNYQKAVRFSDDSYRQWLEQSNQYIIERINEREEREREQKQQLAEQKRRNTYTKAITSGKTARTASELWSIVETFRSLGNYEDAEAQAEHYHKVWEKTARKEKSRKYKISAIIAGILAVAIFIFVLNTYIIPENKYNSALAYIENDSLVEALSILRDLGDYKDSSNLVRGLQTTIAELERIAAEEAAEQARIQAEFEAEQEKLENRYQDALEQIEEGQLLKASSIFRELGDYKDSKEQAENAIRTHKQQIYDNAMQSINDANYHNAITLLESIPDFLDSNEQAKNAKKMAMLAAEKARMDALKTAEVGDKIFIGDYSWTVLDVRDNMMLIISDRGLGYRRYEHNDLGNTWEHSNIRSYLNGYFYEKQFSEDEKEKIIEVVNKNKANPWYESDGGNDTSDRVFLLSLEEVVRYFGDSGLYDNQPEERDPRNLRRTEYIDDQFNFWRSISVGWWLRTPGSRPRSSSHSFTCVLLDGRIKVSGETGSMHIRPALWVSRN